MRALLIATSGDSLVGHQYPNDILDVHGIPSTYSTVSGCSQIRVFGGRYCSVSFITSCVSLGDLNDTPEG